MKIDNKGYSLIELVVVILILMIVAGGTILGVGVLSGKPADQCASSLNISFASHRISAMGQVYDPNSTYLKIRRGTDDCIYLDEKVNGAGVETKICQKGVTFTYKRGGNTYSLNSGDAIKFCFDRSTGAFKLGDDITEINISKSNKEYKMSLYNLTGKVKLTKIR